MVPDTKETQKMLLHLFSSFKHGATEEDLAYLPMTSANIIAIKEAIEIRKLYEKAWGEGLMLLIEEPFYDIQSALPFFGGYTADFKECTFEKGPEIDLIAFIRLERKHKSRDDMFKEIDERGYIPAKIGSFLGIIRQYPLVVNTLQYIMCMSKTPLGPLPQHDTLRMEMRGIWSRSLRDGGVGNTHLHWQAVTPKDFAH